MMGQFVMDLFDISLYSEPKFVYFVSAIDQVLGKDLEVAFIC